MKGLNLTNVISQHKVRLLGKQLYMKRPDSSLEKKKKKKFTMNVLEEIITALFITISIELLYYPYNNSV